MMDAEMQKRIDSLMLTLEKLAESIPYLINEISRQQEEVNKWKLRWAKDWDRSICNPNHEHGRPCQPACKEAREILKDQK